MSVFIITVFQSQLIKYMSTVIAQTPLATYIIQAWGGKG